MFSSKHIFIILNIQTKRDSKGKGTEVLKVGWMIYLPIGFRF